MLSEVVQIYVIFEKVCCVSPHNITMVLAAVNTLKGHIKLGILQLSLEVMLLRNGIR